MFFAVFGLRSGPDGSAQAVGSIWSLFRAERSILDPIRTIFDDLGPNRHCGPDLDLQDQAGNGPLEWVGLGLSSVETRQMSQQQSSVLSQQQTSVLSQQKTSILSQQKTRQLPASGRLL